MVAIGPQFVCAHTPGRDPILACVGSGFSEERSDLSKATSSSAVPFQDSATGMPNQQDNYHNSDIDQLDSIVQKYMTFLQEFCLVLHPHYSTMYMDQFVKNLASSGKCP